MGIEVKITSSESGTKETIALTQGSHLGVLDSIINQIRIPVKCNECSALNILIAEDVQMNAEVNERAQGPESYHHAVGSMPCSKCGQDIEATIDLVEYPLGSITFEDDLVENIENCTYQKDYRF